MRAVSEFMSQQEIARRCDRRAGGERDAKAEPVVEMAEQELSHNVSRHGAGDHQRADGRTIAEVYADRAEVRAVRTGKRRKKSRKDQKPESALPLGAGGRNAVERTALTGERFIVLGAVGRQPTSSGEHRSRKTETGSIIKREIAPNEKKPARQPKVRMMALPSGLPSPRRSPRTPPQGRRQGRVFYGTSCRECTARGKT